MAPMKRVSKRVSKIVIGANIGSTEQKLDVSNIESAGYRMVWSIFELILIKYV